tara:strand:+ start:814 stop:1011 length:198 start_codon:yes stop_codon:yes gene_type:complete
MSKHLKENNVSYLQHMKCSLGYAKESGKAMVYFSIHAFLPDTFVIHGSQKLRQITWTIHNKVFNK